MSTLENTPPSPPLDQSKISLRPGGTEGLAALEMTIRQKKIDRVVTRVPL